MLVELYKSTVGVDFDFITNLDCLHEVRYTW